MSTVSIQRPHVHKGTLGLALLSLCFALSASPAFALDRTLTSYGALCNGTADDTPGLRAAFKDAGSGWTNLIFPSSGVCRIVGKITVSSKSGFRVTGQNATIKATNGMTVAGGWELLVFSQSSNFQVYDLTVDGNRANRTPSATTAHNIVVADSHKFLFQNVRAINSVTDGFEVRGRTQAEGSTAHYSTDGDFVNCQATNSFRIGMSIQNAARINIRGGSFNDTNGVWPQAGIDFESNVGSATPASYDILITGAEFTYNNGFGVQMAAKSAPERITVEKSYFSQNARGGINVGPRYSTIRNNLFELSIRKTGAPCPGTYCFRSVIDIPSGSLGNSMIEGNSIIDAQPYTSGIYAHGKAGSGTTIRYNCLENVKPLAIVNGGNIATLTGNQVNPSGGCPIPLGVPLP
jgi:Right handed beta helix region